MTSLAAHPDLKTLGGSAFALRREAGRRLWLALAAGRDAAFAGATTRAISAVVRERIVEAGGEAVLEDETNAAGERFAFAASVNVNEEAACARPSDRRLRAGDVVTIDAAARYEDLDGLIVDASTALVVPGADAPGRRALVDAALEAVELAAARMRPGVRWREVAEAIVALASERGFGVACGLAGHGVGRTLHEGPTLGMFPGEAPEADFELREGMTLCVEPVLTHIERRNPVAGAASGAEGGYPSASPRRTPTRRLPDGWTVATADRALACCCERTIGVGPEGGVTLTAA